ncbi:unnamed protein product [Clonostachys rosea]|uniref:Protein kinase domain-containing protein n=1 Tax=Bionectria ochroleuca TaxID=29856 RepID=A0ABY6UIR0_BIOOC|nr:unnamed protein product [Clonostachys rosea]
MYDCVKPGTSSNEKRLSEILLDAEVLSTFGNDKKFIPEGSFKHLIDRCMVEYTFSPTKDDDLTEFVLKKAIILFAVTTYTGTKRKFMHEAMKAFKDARITDKNLPLDPESWKCILNDTHGSDDEGFWDRANSNNFLNYQPKFFAPVFDLNRDNHDFRSNTILPFIDEAVLLGKGTFGEVHKYGIHPQHMIKVQDTNFRLEQDFKCPKSVAVKKIQPGSGQERAEMVASWEKEASVLRDMNKLKQIHIVPFFTAFRHGNRGNEDHYLIFEWASGGNLRELWNTLKWERLTSGIVKAVFKQLLGLSEAIFNAHEPSMAAGAAKTSKLWAKDGLKGDFFRHGDLKPENILWFKDEEHDNETGYEMGTLKIGDWGLAKRQNVPTQLRTHRTTTPFGTCRYEPPEERTGQTVNLAPTVAGGTDVKRRSRLYDIWGMGCIFLEFLIWLLYGIEGLKRFNESMMNENSPYPPFYILVNKGGKLHGEVHPSVVEWMDHIANDPACNGDATAIGGLLELIRNSLLVVDLPERLGLHLSDTGHITLSPLAPTAADEDDLQAADADVPQITITETTPMPSISFEHLEEPTTNVIKSRERSRVRARQFYNLMVTLADLEDNNEEEYWLPAQPGHPLGFKVCSHKGDKIITDIPAEKSTAPDTPANHNSQLLGVPSPKEMVTVRNVRS